MTMADKIVVMNSGVIEQAGPPLDLYDRPANVFVAGFIGSPAMNMLDGQVVDGHFRASDGVDWALPGRRTASAGRALLYGIRPEHLRLDQQGIAATMWFSSSRPVRRRRCSCASARVPYGTGPICYRKSAVKEAGFESIPTDHATYLKLLQALKKINKPAGFALGNAVGDGNGFANWLIWSHGG
jgi:MalK OB fold domain